MYTFDTFSGSAPQCLWAILRWQLVEFIPSVLTQFVHLLYLSLLFCVSLPHVPATLTCPQMSWVLIATWPLCCTLFLSHGPFTFSETSVLTIQPQGLCSFTPLYASRLYFLCGIKDLTCLVLLLTSASIFWVPIVCQALFHALGNGGKKIDTHIIYIHKYIPIYTYIWSHIHSYTTLNTLYRYIYTCTYT